MVKMSVFQFLIKNIFRETVILLVLPINSSFRVCFIHLTFLLIMDKDYPALKLDCLAWFNYTFHLLQDPFNLLEFIFSILMCYSQWVHSVSWHGMKFLKVLVSWYFGALQSIYRPFNRTNPPPAFLFSLFSFQSWLSFILKLFLLCSFEIIRSPWNFASGSYSSRLFHHLH